MARPAAMLRELLRSVFKKPATENYPAQSFPMEKNFRGKLIFFPEKCIGCKMCMRDCPTGAIRIEKVGEKRFEAHIDLGLCIYCVQCVDTCPKKALAATPEFELAQLDNAKLKIVYHAAPSVSEDTRPKT